MGFYDGRRVFWQNPQNLPARAFVCGFCNHLVASDEGFGLAFVEASFQGAIHICTNCGGPNFFGIDYRHPVPALGNPVPHVPNAVNTLYEEARRCSSEKCYTAAVLLCRKMLMNIAVEKGAEEGKKFIQYVEFLSEKNYVPPGGKEWVDHIRKKGNEATHEIALLKEEDALDLIGFTEMLLRIIYEFPSRIPKPDAKGEVKSE
jgi:hypothetical protein